MYIPNVTYVLSELNRCLNANGYLIIKEPINKGITDNKIVGYGKKSRGIPLDYFKSLIKKNNFSESTIYTHRFGLFIKIVNYFHIEFIIIGILLILIFYYDG